MNWVETPKKPFSFSFKTHKYLIIYFAKYTYDLRKTNKSKWHFYLFFLIFWLGSEKMKINNEMNFATTKAKWILNKCSNDAYYRVREHTHTHAHKHTKKRIPLDVKPFDIFLLCTLYSLYTIAFFPFKFQYVQINIFQRISVMVIIFERENAKKNWKIANKDPTAQCDAFFFCLQF